MRDAGTLCKQFTAAVSAIGVQCHAIGAGIPHDKLTERIVFATDLDLRHYLTDYIKKQGKVNPRKLNQWRFIPEEWTREAAKRDYKILFPR